MKTPSEWNKNLRNNIVTAEMLNAALYSVNKRAKNCRDKKREYKDIFFDRYHTADKYESKELAYYAKKEKLLAFLTPTCIHIEHLGFEKEDRIYDYEEDFDDKLVSALCKGEISWANSFVNRHYDDDDDDFDCFEDFDNYDNYKRTYFFDKINFDQEKLQYYLFYELGSRSYHTPIKQEDVSKYNLPIVHITQLQTSGREIEELCSVVFVNKVIALLESGNAVLQLEDTSLPIKYDNSYDKNSFESKVRSNNIEFGLDFYGNYILSNVSDEVASQKFDFSTLNDIQKKLATELETKYDVELRNFIQEQEKLAESKLSEIEIKLAELSCKRVNGKAEKKRLKNLRKIKKSLRKIVDIQYKASNAIKKFNKEDFWNSFFCVDSETLYYKPVFNVDYFEDLVDAYMKWINKPNELNPYTEEAIRKQYFLTHIDSIVNEYMGEIKLKAMNLIKKFESLG